MALPPELPRPASPLPRVPTSGKCLYKAVRRCAGCAPLALDLGLRGSTRRPPRFAGHFERERFALRTLLKSRDPPLIGSAMRAHLFLIAALGWTQSLSTPSG